MAAIRDRNREFGERHGAVCRNASDENGGYSAQNADIKHSSIEVHGKLQSLLSRY